MNTVEVISPLTPSSSDSSNASKEDDEVSTSGTPSKPLSAIKKKANFNQLLFEAAANHLLRKLSS